MPFSTTIDLGTIGDSILNESVSISGCTGINISNECTGCTIVSSSQLVTSFPKIITGFEDNHNYAYVEVISGNCVGESQCMIINNKPTPTTPPPTTPPPTTPPPTTPPPTTPPPTTPPPTTPPPTTPPPNCEFDVDVVIQTETFYYYSIRKYDCNNSCAIVSPDLVGRSSTVLSTVDGMYRKIGDYVYQVQNIAETTVFDIDLDTATNTDLDCTTACSLSPECISIIDTVIAPDPQTGLNNYYGVNVALNPFPVSENVTVSGYIRDDVNISNTYDFSITILSGSQSGETDNNVLMTGAADTATIFVTGVTPSVVTYNGNQIGICGFEVNCVCYQYTNDGDSNEVNSISYIDCNNQSQQIDNIPFGTSGYFCATFGSVTETAGLTYIEANESLCGGC